MIHYIQHKLRYRYTKSKDNIYAQNKTKTSRLLLVHEGDWELHGFEGVAPTLRRSLLLLFLLLLLLLLLPTLVSPLPYQIRSGTHRAHARNRSTCAPSTRPVLLHLALGYEGQ